MERETLAELKSREIVDRSGCPGPLAIADQVVMGFATEENRAHFAVCTSCKNELQSGGGLFS